MNKRAKRDPQAPIYQLTDQDHQILRHTAHDLDAFCQWYFEQRPIPWQTWFYHKPQKRKTLIAGIRSGKTYCISLAFPHFALFHPYARLANASISADQAKIVFYNVLDLVSRSRFEKFVKDSRKHPFPVIEFINGSELWFRSVGYEAELWRGWEFDWINIDEGAYISTRATIDTLDGRLLGRNNHLNRPRENRRTITTSPKGRGWLLDEFKKGDPQWPDYVPEQYLSLRVSSFDNPYLDKAALNTLWMGYSDRQRKQELDGQFLDPEDAVFSWEACQWMCNNQEREEVQALTRQIEELQDEGNGEHFIPKELDPSGGDYRRYQLPPGQGRSYLCSWDLGTTATRHLGRNATVGMVLDITELPWRLVAFRREPKASYSLIVQWIRDWHLYYNNRGLNGIETLIDATGSGKPVQEILQDEYNLDAQGIIYTSTSKPEIISAGAVAIERGQVITPPIRSLMDELSAYEMHDKKIVQDCVMTFCQALHRARERNSELRHVQSEIILPTRAGYRRGLEEASQRYEARRIASRGERTNRRRA